VIGQIKLNNRNNVAIAIVVVATNRQKIPVLNHWQFAKVIEKNQ
jgi:hypothetical protein